MNYKEYKLYDLNDYNKFRSIEKATNPGKKIKGYIYAIKTQLEFRTGTLSVNRQSPYEYFSRNQFLSADRDCIVVLSEPHLNYKQNHSIIKDHELFEQAVYDSTTDFNTFKTLLKSLTIDGKFIETDDRKPKTEKTTGDIKFSSMDKGDLYLFLHKKLGEIEKINSVINENKKKRDEIHTTIKNAEYRLKQLL